MTNEKYCIIILLANLTSFFVEGYYLNKFYSGIIKTNIRNRNYIVMIPAGYIFCMMVLKYIPVVMESFEAYAIGILTAALLSYIAYRRETILKLYLSVTFMAVRYLGYYLAFDISEFLYRKVRILEDNPFQGSLYEVITYLILLQFLQWLVLNIVINTIIKKFRNKKVYFTFSEAVLFLMPSIAGMFGGFFVNYFKKIVQQDTKDFYFSAVIVVGTIVFILSIVTSIVLFQNMIERKEEEKNKIILERQMNNINSHLQKVEQLYSGIRGMKHDLRNHISNIEILIAHEQYEEVMNYVKQFEITMDQLEFYYKTGNPITDVVINEFYREANEQHITSEIEFVYPIHSRINAFDVCIILSNALENAIEACEGIKDKENLFITVHSYRRKNAYFIEISNSFQQKLIYGEESLPKTIKKEKEMHGLGLKNIQSIARKYQGEIDIEIIADRKFVLTVMLMICD